MVDILTQFWLWDRDLSASIAVNSGPENPVIHLRPLFIWLELLVHGIPWLVGTVISLFLSLKFHFPQSFSDGLTILLIALLIDLTMVGIIKLLLQRPRPTYNDDDQMGNVSFADIYSFPSGHSSRAAMLVVLCLYLAEVTGLMAFILYVFPLMLGLSRVMSGRHFISDVLFGLLFGICQGIFAVHLIPTVVLRFCQTFMPFP